MISTSSIIGSAHRLVPTLGDQREGSHFGLMLSITTVIAAMVAWNSLRISRNLEAVAKVEREVAEYKNRRPDPHGSTSVEFDEMQCREFVRQMRLAGDRRLQDLFDPSKDS